MKYTPGLVILLLPFQLLAQFPTNEGVAIDDPSILGWGGEALIERGPQQIDSTQFGQAEVGSGVDAAGVANFQVVSLGEGGSATYEFDPALGDGPGWDLAIFENGFASGDGFFLELAFVEVSSDGEHYVRFPATSLTDTTQQIGTFDLLYPNQLNQLAGKYEGGLGTPFDLQRLVDSAGIDIQHITHLRIIDVVGQLENGRRDQAGRPINDPWPTPFASSGFDLDAMAFRYLGTTSTPEANSPLNEIAIYPNPAFVGEPLNLQLPEELHQEDLYFRWYDQEGKLIQQSTTGPLVTPAVPGSYFLQVSDGLYQQVRTIIVE